ncbi:RNA 2',3'-cyclic phosphodiesterase, partial [Candidatus Deferrimicrobium sp.]|uniref:RNA 2',3'-cyclic phosphodiesterase n=1 Tax=Candidatus Deferrimicrobium sp. TaxID=3060586 RepID=UPI003C379E62
MRAFLGIGLPAGVRETIASAIRQARDLHPPIAWTAPKNLHITMNFLGEIFPERVPLIERSMRVVSCGVAPFSLTAEGGGAFPGTRNPRVLWVGFLEPLELVGQLQQNMGNALSGAGFPREDRPFHPHITVGRTRGALPPAWGERFVQALSGKRFGVVPVSSFTLYESRLGSGGAVYTPLCDFRLEGSGKREIREEKE